MAVFAAGQAPHRIAIRAGKWIDGKSDKLIENALILIERDKITAVTPGASAPAGAEMIDLSKATVLPGFIDVHTHVLTQSGARAGNVRRGLDQVLLRPALALL